MPYTTTTQALSATTAQVINGSQPYLTFDNGVTKVTTSDDLLGITISDGINQITYTPANNTSTANNPIVLLKEKQSFMNIGILTDSTINLSDLISEYSNYWDDDDGDGINGVTASGSLSASITDRDNQVVNRRTTLDMCQAPYKVVLTNTDINLTTQYGVPNTTSFTANSTTYYISPKGVPKICFARPSLDYGRFQHVGPTNIWDEDKGFLVQSTNPSSYNTNFPTTGGNNLFFDLHIGGIDGSTLTWPAITQGGITATMTPSPDNPNNIRVTLTGPAATASQIQSDSPGSIVTPILPQTFELVGYDSSHTAVLKYGFVLKQWFVHRGNLYLNYANHSSWCTSIGGGYHLPQVKDLTNAMCTSAAIAKGDRCQGAVGAMPSSEGNYYQRNIGAGFFGEWGLMDNYPGFVTTIYWASGSSDPDRPFVVFASGGDITNTWSGDKQTGVCTYP